MFEVTRIGLIMTAVLSITGARAAEWEVEDGSVVGFTALQQGAPVEGRFEAFEADIVFDPTDLETSRIEVDIDTRSIATGHTDRDTTLRSSAFFDVERWPTARFASSDIREIGEGRYQAHGTLTMRDVQKDVVLPFSLEIEGDEAEARGELPVSRLDYGIGQGSWAATTTVADEVVIRIEIKALRSG